MTWVCKAVADQQLGKARFFEAHVAGLSPWIAGRPCFIVVVVVVYTMSPCAALSSMYPAPFPMSFF
jgi:hypothetical protein